MNHRRSTFAPIAALLLIPLLTPVVAVAAAEDDRKRDRHQKSQEHHNSSGRGHRHEDRRRGEGHHGHHRHSRYGGYHWRMPRWGGGWSLPPRYRHHRADWDERHQGHWDDRRQGYRDDDRRGHHKDRPRGRRWIEVDRFHTVHLFREQSVVPVNRRISAIALSGIKRDTRVRRAWVEFGNGKRVPLHAFRGTVRDGESVRHRFRRDRYVRNLILDVRPDQRQRAAISVDVRV